MEFFNKSEVSKIAMLDMKSQPNANSTLPTALKFGLSKSSEEFYYTKVDPSLPWGDDEKVLYVFNNCPNPKPFIRLYPSPFAQTQMTT